MLNVVALVGRLVADPELKYTPSGKAVCSLRVAVDRRFKNQSGERETDFFDVSVWGQPAEFSANYLSKGRLVSISGRLQQRSWVQQDGQKRSKVDIVADDIQGLDRPREGGQSPGAATEQEPAAAQTPSAEFESQSDMDYDPFAEE